MFLMPTGNTLIAIPATRTFLAVNGFTGTASSYTVSGASLGTISSDRQIVVCLWGSNFSRTLTSVTVGGTSCTVLADGTADHTAAIAIVSKPTGSTGDIVITWSGTRNSCAVAHYSVYGAASTVTDSYSNASAVLASTMDCPAGGIIIATSYSNQPSTWTGVTEDCDIQHGVEGYISTASDEFDEAQVNLTINQGSANGNSAACAAFISLGPV